MDIGNMDQCVIERLGGGRDRDGLLCLSGSVTTRLEAGGAG